MSERLAEIYLLLVSCGIPAEEAGDFVTALPQVGWGAARRRKYFLKKYGDLITTGVAARNEQTKATPIAGLFR